jgi:hypothetical protein
MSFTDFFTSTGGGTGGGGFSLPPLTAFSFPQGGSFGITPQSQFASVEFNRALPYLNLWNQNLHEYINDIIATPHPTAEDIQKVLDKLKINSGDLLVWIDKNIHDAAMKSDLKRIVNQATQDLQSELTALKNRLSEPQATAVKNNDLWLLLAGGALFIILLLALFKAKK